MKFLNTLFTTLFLIAIACLSPQEHTHGEGEPHSHDGEEHTHPHEDGEHTEQEEFTVPPDSLHEDSTHHSHEHGEDHDH